MNIKSFTLIKYADSGRYIFNIDYVNKHGLVSPILWCRDGEFRLIPKPVILNLIADADMYAKMDCVKTTHPKLIIFWSQGIPISNQAGRALLGE